MKNSSTSDPIFTICVLLYGDYPELAKRCLNSLLPFPDNPLCELRIGMNAVGKETREFVDTYCNFHNSCSVNTSLYADNENNGKYPMMRRMLNQDPVFSPYVIWFDDDSYVISPTNIYYKRLYDVMEMNYASRQKRLMTGHLRYINLRGNQEEWIKDQPWYKDKQLQDIPADLSSTLKRIVQIKHFSVGGWWCISTECLKQLDWPPTNITHRGGDYMLGEAMRQNDFAIINYEAGVKINAGGDGNAHTSPRRGLDPLPIGIDYSPQLTTILHRATSNIDPVLLDQPNS